MGRQRADAACYPLTSSSLCPPSPHLPFPGSPPNPETWLHVIHFSHKTVCDENVSMIILDEMLGFHQEEACMKIVKFKWPSVWKGLEQVCVTCIEPILPKTFKTISIHNLSEWASCVYTCCVVFCGYFIDTNILLMPLVIFTYDIKISALTYCRQTKVAHSSDPATILMFRDHVYPRTQGEHRPPSECHFLSMISPQ